MGADLDQRCLGDPGATYQQIAELAFTDRQLDVKLPDQLPQHDGTAQATAKRRAVAADTYGLGSGRPGFGIWRRLGRPGGVRLTSAAKAATAQPQHIHPAGV